MMDSTRIKKSGLDMVIQKSYNLLGFNVLPDSRRARSKSLDKKKAQKAPQAAGKIHTDIERFY